MNGEARERVSGSPAPLSPCFLLTLTLSSSLNPPQLEREEEAGEGTCSKQPIVVDGMRIVFFIVRHCRLLSIASVPQGLAESLDNWPN